ncbi:MAG: metal-dependent transcriptional regulator [Oscillospiraceae bacterium]|nr:metal-dependent transcriptional regulator [Oscillospiraceae bacterium]MCR4760260.1 metal-dependent transcriptional regulator [Oscillospiraceae bacterium]
MAKLYKSGEDYLETILILHLKDNYVRAVDIAHEMDVSKPSVSRAMGILRDGGFISIAADGNITLTETGSEVAERIYERHLVLTQWLTDIGVSPDVAAADACKLEHDISMESFACLKEHLRQSHPNIRLEKS